VALKGSGVKPGRRKRRSKRHRQNRALLLRCARMNMPATRLGRILRLGLLLACPAALVATGETSAPPNPRYTGDLASQEWTPEETGGKPQSFSIRQNPATGLIYAGNEAGVLEYDGARWRRLPLPAGAPAEGLIVRGLELDGEGRLWAAGENDVLVYAPDEHGRWRPESLRARLPATEPELGVVWDLRRQDGFMWGVTTRGLLRIDMRSWAVRRWPLAGNPAIVGLVDGEVWFRYNGNQLMRSRAGEVEPVSVPALPDGLWGLGVSRTTAGVLQFEHGGGVLELRDGVWVPLSAGLSQALAGPASRVRRLPDGGRIFSTRSRTLLVVDAAGIVLGRIAEPPGVNFGVTPQTCLDRDGGFWMVNASGIRRLQLDSVIVRHGPAEGLRGGARKLAFDGPALLVASAQGLFVRDAVTGKFAVQAGSPSDQQSLLPSPAGGWLMAAGQRFGEWRDGAMVAAPGMPGGGLSLAADPRDSSRVFVGGLNEAAVYRRQSGGWRKETVLSGMPVSLYYAAGDAAGSLWFSAGFMHGVWRATAAEGNWAAARVERMDDGPGGAPAATWRVASVGGEVLVYGPQGVWHEAVPGGRLVPDASFTGLPRGAATPLLNLASGNDEKVIYAAGALDLRDRIWRGLRARADAPWEFTELPLAAARGWLRLEDMRESPDGRTLWLGGTEAAFSVDLTAPAGAFAAPEARWRRVENLGADEISYGGAGGRATVALPRGRRAVALEFSAPSLRVHLGGRTGIEYRTRATGVDRDWTAWSASAARELTNLPPGEVKLEVQARNHLGMAGPVAVLTLTLPPFWWETWWARALGVLAGTGAVAAVVSLLVRRQFKQRIALLEAQAAVQQERLRIARDMHDDLGSTLASIVHLSDRQTALGGAPDKALDRIHEATRELVHRTRDIVWAATPQHDSLESLIEQLAGHAERTLGDRGVTVKVELPAQVPEEAIGSAARHDLFLAFKEAVNNAAKYAQARTAVVRVELSARALTVTLADDGVGFAPGALQGTGNGLGNLHQRLAALGGSAQIASTVGQGTTVTLRLPRTTAKG
jgi:signal transduction histidine kinase